jgi:serpin B
MKHAMNTLHRVLAAALVAALLAGCVPGAGPSSGALKSFKSDQPRQSAPQVAEDDARALAAGNNQFALDLYQALGKEKDNFFYSPFSISLALAMTYAGARGETQRQMAETLHFELPGDRLHPAFNALDQELARRKDVEGGQGSDGKGFRLNVANDIWGQQDYTFLPEFLDTLAVNYGAGLRAVDFKSDPDGVRKAINDDIARKTEQRIKDLIPPGQIDTLTRLVLTNAIYFNAAWMHPFEKSLTKDRPFTRLDGSQVNVPMMVMSGSERMLYAAGNGYQAAALPYEGGKLSMLVLVPDAGQFEAFEDGLDAAALESILSSMQFSGVHISMPKFQTESDFSLSEALTGLGMADAFSPDAADFSGMDGQKGSLYIGEVIHKSFVKVDEAGTEAAAATAVIMEATSAMIEVTELTIDRPFIYVIRDEPTNTILFVGRVLDPAR